MAAIHNYADFYEWVDGFVFAAAAVGGPQLPTAGLKLQQSDQALQGAALAGGIAFTSMDYNAQKWVVPRGDDVQLPMMLDSGVNAHVIAQANAFYLANAGSL